MSFGLSFGSRKSWEGLGGPERGRYQDRHWATMNGSWHLAGMILSKRRRSTGSGSSQVTLTITEKGQLSQQRNFFGILKSHVSYGRFCHFFGTISNAIAKPWVVLSFTSIFYPFWQRQRQSQLTEASKHQSLSCFSPRYFVNFATGKLDATAEAVSSALAEWSLWGGVGSVPKR